MLGGPGARGRTATAHGQTHNVAAAPAILVGRRPLARAARGHRGPSAPRITTQPWSESVPAGQTASFTAVASGTPAPSAQWQRSTNRGRTWRNIRGARGITYAFAVSAADSGYRYRVVFRNSRGHATSRAASLMVRRSSSSGGGSGSGGGSTGSGAPQIISQPASVAVAPGDTATFNAAASGTPTPSAQWEVSADGGATWAAIPGANADTYAVLAQSTGAGNEYRAVFSNASGTAATNPATLTVSAGGGGAQSGAPQIATQPESVSVESGASASFTAAAAGSPPLSVQWEVSTDGGNTWGTIPGADTTTYSLTATLSENAYEYRAVFTNTAGSSTTSAATLTVTAGSGASSPEITTQPSDDIAAVDGTASFTAAASGTPTPTVQWQVSSNGGAGWSDISGATSTTYTFTAYNGMSAYEYRAVFTNTAGVATTNAAILTVAQESSNWSGYAVTGAAFNNVSADWTVPGVSCTGTTTYSSQWIGIDGYDSPTVEQDGTESDCFSGTPSYDAWYEMYGDNAVNGGAEVELPPTTYPVAPGDAMTATVSLSGSTWTLAIADTTQEWNYSTNIPTPSPAPQQSSAEWIVERPEVGGGLATLSDYGTTTFTHASASDGGASGSITAFAHTPLEMVGSTPLSTPGLLDAAGDSFTTTWYGGS